MLDQKNKCAFLGATIKKKGNELITLQVRIMLPLEGGRHCDVNGKHGDFLQWLVMFPLLILADSDLGVYF